jgi:protein SCO1/2
MMAEAASSKETPPQALAWTLRLCVGLMLGGVVVGIAYMQRNRYEANSSRPPYITKIERDFEAVAEDGSRFRLSSMKGKVYLAALCSAQEGATPPAFPGMIQDVAKDHADRKDFGVVLFSATPERDTPPAMQAFLARNGLSQAGWRFLSGESEALARYVKRYLRLYPVMPEQAALPSAVRHDTRVVLVDRKANIRGYYRILDPDQGTEYLATLRMHLSHVLENP